MNLPKLEGSPGTTFATLLLRSGHKPSSQDHCTIPDKKYASAYSQAALGGCQVWKIDDRHAVLSPRADTRNLEEPDLVDKRCRSTLASYPVGLVGVTNLVNLRKRTHAISAWCDAMQ